MNNSVSLLVSVLEPMVADLELKRELLTEKRVMLENVSRLLAYTKDNVDMLGFYSDQDLILNNLDKVNSDKDEYKASCYLLKSENSCIKNLPQYKKAHSLINDIIEYFMLYKSDLTVETQDLEKKCMQKEIQKKYCDLLKQDTPYIDDVEEFRKLLDDQSLPNQNKIDILLYAINKNKLKYGITE